MTGATAITLMGGAVATALVPLVVGLLAAWVAYGRTRLVPLSAAPRVSRRAVTPLSTMPARAGR